MIFKENKKIRKMFISADLVSLMKLERQQGSGIDTIKYHDCTYILNWK